MSAYPAALREFHEPGDDRRSYCWAGGKPFACRPEAALSDEMKCVDLAFGEHGYTLSIRSAMSYIEACMHKAGWMRMADLEVVD